MKQRVFGSHRTIGDDLLKLAGSAAEGFQAVYPYDPTRADQRWQDFNLRFESEYHEKPDHFAALAYDAMQILLNAICCAGLNRGRIRDALTAIENYRGVTGEMTFDPNCKNISPMFLATVRNGSIEYHRITMEKPYAKVGEDGVQYSGPPLPDQPAKELRIAILGPRADELARSPEFLARLEQDNDRESHFALVPIPSEQSWGKASNALVNAVYQDHVLGIIALDRKTSHLAEQIGTKAFIPVIALSSDRMLTSTNIPWIFRVSPDTSPQKVLDCLLSAISSAGPSRERIRALLSSGAPLAGFRFTSTGEPNSIP